MTAEQIQSFSWDFFFAKLSQAAQGILVDQSSFEQLSIGVEVAGGPRWTLLLKDHRLEVLRGPTEQADLIIKLDEATAELLATGKLSVLEALGRGLVKVGGRIDLLGQADETLSSLQRSLADRLT
jgi:hypothetical protein